MSSECPGKNSWPELVGTNGDDAASVIKRENSEVVDAIVILDGSPVIADFRCDRVWVRVDENHIVVKIPTTG